MTASSRNLKSERVLVISGMIGLAEEIVYSW